MNTIKKLFSLLVIGTVCLWPAAASAHVLETSGSIGAIMHMDPDDDPIAGTDTTFYFDIKDKKSQFTLADCDCSFTVKQAGNELTSQAVSGSASSAVANYTFPDRGVYTIGINGQPLGSANFEKFSLSYSIRVDRTSAAATSTSSSTADSPGGSNALVYTLGGLMVAAFVAMLGLSLKKRQTPKR